MATTREWDTLRNSFAHRLYAVFDTVLPVSSPLFDEAELIAFAKGELLMLADEWRPHVERFLDARLQLAAGDATPARSDGGFDYAPLLWGAPSEDAARGHVRQHSIFGQHLGPATLLAAIGTTVHRSRERVVAQPGPVWNVFDLPSMLRSYYDPLVIACLIRWLRPEEIWWGRVTAAGASVPSDAYNSVVMTLERASTDDLLVLVPELLLGAGHGKVPADAADYLRQKALALLSDPPPGSTAHELLALASALFVWYSEQARRLPASADLRELGLPALPELLR